MELTGGYGMVPGRVAIVIATHRYCFPLELCLRGHLQLVDSPLDIVFVDNGSGGEMTSWVKDRFPEVTVITRKENGFFCGGYNSGIQHAIKGDYEYVLIVNADTEVCDSTYLTKLVSAAERHRDAAFLGPRVFLREPGNVQNTILRYPWFRRHLSHWLASRFRARNASAATNTETRVDFLNGVCTLCRVDALREIGLMDEKMGGYVEDTDWSWRARQMGWHSLYVPVTSVVHHQAADEYSQCSMKTFMLRRNHIYWHVKTGHAGQAYLFAVCSLTLARMRVIQAILQRRDVEEHRRYVTRFRNVARRILSREPVDDWFGPPAGKL